MSEFLIYAFAILNLVVLLLFAGLLTLLYLRTRSKGLLVITATLIISWLFGWIFSAAIGHYTNRWLMGEVNNWLTQRITIGEFTLILHYVKGLLRNGLLVLGIFLIYQEWSRGKIHWRPHKPSEGINAELNSSLG